MTDKTEAAPASTVPIRPGQTIGVVGGGQLGRMLGQAARAMGYRFVVLDPSPKAPAAAVADEVVTAPFDDLEGARRFASAVDVVTYEFENVPAETLEAIATLRPVHPSPRALAICRDRRREKTFLDEVGIPVAPWAAFVSEPELEAALRRVGRPAIMKTATLGYDGKGQVRLDATNDALAAWQQLGGRPAVLEGVVSFAEELSVIVARGVDGETTTYPPFSNHHERHILDVTVCPAPVADDVARAARALAVRVAEALDFRGVLCLELFRVHHDGTGRDELLVNELAPRPHNSGHLTIDAARTSQFEQQLRAVCGLPLGSSDVDRPAAMANLLGDLFDPGPLLVERALEDPAVKLHLYGKTEARPGRKMGHLVALGDDVEDARRRVLRAREALNGTSPSPPSAP